MSIGHRKFACYKKWGWFGLTNTQPYRAARKKIRAIDPSVPRWALLSSMRDVVKVRVQQLIWRVLKQSQQEGQGEFTPPPPPPLAFTHMHTILFSSLFTLKEMLRCAQSVCGKPRPDLICAAEKEHCLIPPARQWMQLHSARERRTERMGQGEMSRAGKSGIKLSLTRLTRHSVKCPWQAALHPQPVQPPPERNGQKLYWWLRRNWEEEEEEEEEATFKVLNIMMTLPLQVTAFLTFCGRYMMLYSFIFHSITAVTE